MATYDTWKSTEPDDGREPPDDDTQAGAQRVLSIAPHDPSGLARKLASERLRPTVEQSPCDHGLFGDEMDQSDLLDRLR